MSVSLLKVIADLNLSLASAVSVGATTATLNTAVDSDGVALPSGKYGFTVDGDNTSKEFFVCDLVGTALTNVQSISKQGAATTGFSTYHRTGAVITITDWAVLDRVVDNLTGVTGFDSGTPLKYDGQPTLSDPTAIPTVQFVLDEVNGGPVTFDRQIITGDAGENVSAGDWVYFNTTDGEWYLTDADDTAKSLNVRIGKAIGAGTNGNPIAGGIFVSGTETVGTYVAGTTYYLSNTAGALSTSAGTNSVVVGVGDANGDLVLNQPRPSQTDAMAGGGYLGTPSTANKFLTESTRTAVIQYDLSGSPHTWTKDAGLLRVRVQAWGGGGSGAARTGTNVSGGGGGGGYMEAWFEASVLGATETITIGAGGAAISGNSAGNNGANTTFGSLLTAYGGLGGETAGATAAGGNGGDVQAGSTLFRGLGVSNAAGGIGIFYGGGAGGGGGVGSPGGGALFGGAGGGGAGTVSAGAGGASIYGGNGGSGGTDTNGTAGAVPGGGGGGANDGNSGAGGNGRVIITEYYL